MIIKALNMYGRVPETWELLKEIERLNNIINGFDKWLDEESEKTIYSTGHLTSLLMCKNKLQELKGNGSNVKD